MNELLEKYFELENEEDSRNLRRIRVRTVIVTSTLPESVKRNLRVVKDLYAHGMFEAVTIYCRALLEASIDDAVDRQDGRARTIESRMSQRLRIRRKEILYVCS